MYYHQVTVKNKVVSVLLSQVRTFSAKRIEDKLAELDRYEFIETIDLLNRILFSLSSSFEKESHV